MCNGAKEYGSDRSRKMLKNEYLLATIGVDTAENEPKVTVCCNAVTRASALQPNVRLARRVVELEDAHDVRVHLSLERGEVADIFRVVGNLDDDGHIRVHAIFREVCYALRSSRQLLLNVVP